MEISTVPNDRNSADVTQRVEFGADAESDTQTVPSMEKVERQQRAVTTPGEMWATWNQVLRIWHQQLEPCVQG